jgi:hypothetical protein
MGLLNDIVERLDLTDGLGQEALGRPLVPLLGAQNVNWLAGFIHRAIQVLPRAFAPYVRLMEALGQRRNQLLTLQGGLE